MNQKTTLGGIALVMALTMVFSIGSGVVSAFVPTYEDIEFINWMRRRTITPKQSYRIR